MNEVGKEYGAALYLLGREENCVEQLREDIDTLSRLFENEKEYLSFLQTPAVPMEARLASLFEVCSALVSPHAVSFVQLLLEKGRLARFGEARDAFVALYEEAARMLKVKIRSAVALDDGQKQRLQTKLETVYSAKVYITYEIDPSLIGGVVMETEDQVTDGSIRHRLQEVKEVIER